MRPVIAGPGIALLVYRAWKKKSLTPAGMVAAVATALAHAYHPWPLPFVLLVVFFLAGTRATHIKEDVKARLTLHASGKPTEGPRTHVQVFANSFVASVLSVMHAIQLRRRRDMLVDPSIAEPSGSLCFEWGGDLLVIGIIANYAAVAADTFSSELGILSKSDPRLITSLSLRKVPRGTNGGVTLMGLGAGALGSVIIVTTSVLFTPVCTTKTVSNPGGGMPWTVEQRRMLMGFMVIWGTLGSLLDSFLGGVLQRSVKDVRSGKIVEGDGGARVLVSSRDDSAPTTTTTKTHGVVVQGKTTAPGKDGVERNVAASRIVESGLDLLDNNGVNFLMALTMSVGGMALAGWYWDVPLHSILEV